MQVYWPINMIKIFSEVFSNRYDRRLYLVLKTESFGITFLKLNLFFISFEKLYRNYNLFVNFVKNLFYDDIFRHILLKNSNEKINK